MFWKNKFEDLCAQQQTGDLFPGSFAQQTATSKDGRYVP